jgi:prepilin-type N-terminal cleavage/methylation domain-containing protein
MGELRKIQSRESEGFTLLEVLIAVVILAIGLLAIAQMQIISIRFNAQGRDMTEATTLAMDTLEHLKSLPFENADLTDSDAGNNGDLTDTVSIDHADPNNPVDPQGIAGGRYTRIWNVADGADTKSVVVVVTWLSGPNRIPRQVRCSTLISNPNP